MVKMKKCGYNRLRVVPSTITHAGYGLFLDTRVLKAGNMITSYEGKHLSRQEALQSKSDYIFEETTATG